MNLPGGQGQEGIFLSLRMDAIAFLLCFFVLSLCLTCTSVKCTLPNQGRGISVSFWVLARNNPSLIVPALNYWEAEVVLFCCVRCYKWDTKWFSVLHRALSSFFSFL